MALSAAQRGFDDAVRESQRTFRLVLDAMAHAGRILRSDATLAPPPPLLSTSASIILALADFETAIWLDEPTADCPAVADFLRFHTGARLVRACRDADFAIIAAPARMPPLASFAQGTPEYPDRSTTLIVQVEALAGVGWQFRGPGIQDSVHFSATPMPLDFPQQLLENRARFPRGVDLVFATSTEIAALPRSARITTGPVCTSR